MMLLKKTVYDKLVKKVVNKIDTSEFISKNKYQTDHLELENSWYKWAY